MAFYRPNSPEPAALRLLGDAIDLTLITTGTIIVVIMFVNVLARSILDADIAWNTEFGELMLVWATFIGAAAAARRLAHMRITELIGSLPQKISKPIEITTRLGVLLLLAVAVWSGGVIVLENWDQQMTVLYWPVALVYLAMPVGSFLAAVYVAYDTYLIATGVIAPASNAGMQVE